MPIQAPSWTDFFFFCPICCNEFAVYHRLPISLGCGHTHNRHCPSDQISIATDVDYLPINNAILQMISTNSNNNSKNNSGNINDHSNNNGGGSECPSRSDGDSNTVARHTPPNVRQVNPEDLKCYNLANKCGAVSKITCYQQWQLWKSTFATGTTSDVRCAEIRTSFPISVENKYWSRCTVIVSCQLL